MWVQPSVKSHELGCFLAKYGCIGVEKIIINWETEVRHEKSTTALKGRPNTSSEEH